MCCATQLSQHTSKLLRSSCLEGVLVIHSMGVCHITNTIQTSAISTLAVSPLLQGVNFCVRTLRMVVCVCVYLPDTSLFHMVYRSYCTLPSADICPSLRNSWEQKMAYCCTRCDLHSQMFSSHSPGASKLYMAALACNHTGVLTAVQDAGACCDGARLQRFSHTMTAETMEAAC